MRNLLRVLIFVVAYIFVSRSVELVGPEKCIIFSLTTIVIWLYCIHIDITDELKKIKDKLNE